MFSRGLASIPRWSLPAILLSGSAPERVSGLIEVREILRDVEGIEFVYFDERDVVRHKLVQDIIKAYDQHQNPAQSSSSPPGAAGRRPSPSPQNKQPKPAPPSSPLTDSWGQSH